MISGHFSHVKFGYCCLTDDVLKAFTKAFVIATSS